MPDLIAHSATEAHAPTPLAIDWGQLLEQRPAVLRHSDMPAYLLLPEVHALLDATLDDNSRLLLNTLWHTGARVSEALALTPAHFELSTRLPYVSIETLKTRGRPRKHAAKKPRLLPLSDEHYLRQVERYITTHGVRRQARFFPVTRSAINKRLERLTAPLNLTVPVSPHTFRHSFAVNAVLHGTPLPVLQGWLGHADIASTLIYTRVLTLETHHLMRRIQF